MCRSPHLSTQIKQFKDQLGWPSFEWTGRILTTVITLGFVLLPIFTFVVGRN